MSCWRRSSIYVSYIPMKYQSYNTKLLSFLAILLHSSEKASCLLMFTKQKHTQYLFMLISSKFIKYEHYFCWISYITIMVRFLSEVRSHFEYLRNNLLMHLTNIGTFRRLHLWQGLCVWPQVWPKSLSW